MKAIALVLALLLPARAALAQHAASSSRLIISEAAIARGLAEHPPARVAQSRDSLKNGAIIGAVIGAAVFGGYVTFLCKALQEPSDPSCFKSSLLAIGIGAGGGAAAGAGVDALFARGSGWRGGPTDGRALASWRSRPRDQTSASRRRD